MEQLLLEVGALDRPEVTTAHHRTAGGLRDRRRWSSSSLQGAKQSSGHLHSAGSRAAQLCQLLQSRQPLVQVSPIGICECLFVKWAIAKSYPGELRWSIYSTFSSLKALPRQAVVCTKHGDFSAVQNSYCRLWIFGKWLAGLLPGHQFSFSRDALQVHSQFSSISTAKAQINRVPLLK